MALACLAGCSGADHQPAGPDAAVVLNGTPLAPGDMDLAGITSDDVAVVLDRDGSALAVPLDGAGAQVIDPSSDRIVVSGGVVFSFRRFDPLGGIGDLTV